MEKVPQKIAVSFYGFPDSIPEVSTVKTLPCEVVGDAYLKKPLLINF